MRISAHILPRRVILAVLILMAFALRMWGIAWGLQEPVSTHPGEWTWRIIESLSLSNPTYPDIWAQSFFTLAALVRWILGICQAWLEVLVGQVRTTSEVVINPLLAGRMTVAWLGAMQAWAAYMLARRCFDSVATGLLAAAVIAVSPALVMQSHYLTVDIPLGFMFLLCWWCAWNIMEEPGRRSFLWAGFIWGLTITTKGSGLMAGFFLLSAYGITCWRHRPHWQIGFGLWPLCFAGGLILGLLIGYPGFIFNFNDINDILKDSVMLPPLVMTGDWQIFIDRLKELAFLFSTSLGWIILALWLAAIFCILRRRRYDRLLPALFPPCYLLLSLSLLTGSPQAQTAVWLPTMAVVCVWPCVLLCRLLPGRWRQVGGVAVLGLLLCVFPLWHSLGLGYLFWQQNTIEAARFWLQAHQVKAEDVRLADPLPLNLLPGSKRWLGDKESSSASDGPLYLLAQKGQNAPGQAVQCFYLPMDMDTFGLLANAPPPGITPSLDLHILWPPEKIRHHLAIFRPWVGSERTYAEVYGYEDSYDLNNGAMWLTSPGVSQRVLRRGKDLKGMALTVSNFGRDLARFKVRQGLWQLREMSLYPGQTEDVLLSPLVWPPMLQESYPVRIVLDRGEDLVANLSWTPLLMGRSALEAGKLEQAATFLRQAVLDEEGFDASVLLAGTLARLGEYIEAGNILDSLADIDGNPAKTYLDLAALSFESREWQRKFKEFAGYYPQLIEKAYSTTYHIKRSLCPWDGPESYWGGEGFEVGFSRPDNYRLGQLIIWPQNIFPAGQWQIRMALETDESLEAGEALASVEVWSHYRGAGVMVARHLLTQSQWKDGQQTAELVLPVQIAPPGAKLELRVNYLTTKEIVLENLTVQVDVPAHMRKILRWYYEAWGRVALQAGRFQTAITSFEALLKLDPDFHEAYLPLAEAKLDAGLTAEAAYWAERAEKVYASFPEKLEQVHNLYTTLRLGEQAARVEGRLSALRPSLKRTARFQGGMTLLGYDLSQSAAAPGQTIGLNYYWQVWSAPSFNYFIFVHLKKTDSLLPLDHLLDHGRASMLDLKVGQVIREDYRVTIPPDLPPGQYQLLLGLWDPSYTRQRNRILEGEGSGSDEVVLTTIEIR